MKRTVSMLLLLGVLTGAAGLAVPAPALAQAPPPASFKEFSGSFVLDGLGLVSVSGLARLVPISPPLTPAGVFVINTQLLNGTLSVNGDTDVFAAAASYYALEARGGREDRGTLPQVGEPFEFAVPYLVVATRQSTIPPPVRVFYLLLRYNVTLRGDGSLTINRIQVPGLDIGG